MTPRVHIPLDGPWAFARRRMGRAWLRGSRPDPSIDVMLPHSWNAEDAFQPGVAYYRGWGSYRACWEVPAAAPPDGTRTWLCAGGFYGTGDVWWDGRRIARVCGDDLGFALDVTEHVRTGARHTIGVRLTNRCARNVLPGTRMPDFLLHGGLAGGVWIERRLRPGFARERTHIEIDDRPADAQVRVTPALEGESAPDGLRIHATLHAPADEPLAHAEGAPGEPIALRVAEPQRWHPDHPALYTLRLELRRGATVLDAETWRIGLRTVTVHARDGLCVNGARMVLQGCNRHASMPGFGNALPAGLHWRDAQAIKDAGCNFVRLSHYPQDPAFLDACDTLGLFVYAEVSSWKSVRGGGWLRNAKRQLEAMIRRDRHRPCMLFWGLGNEGRHRGAYRELDALAHALDPGRPTIYAENHLHRARRACTLGLTDVWGCNYETDQLEAGRAACRSGTALVTECCNAPHAVRGQLMAEAAQVEQIRALHRDVRFEGGVLGYALWSFNDYATLRKERFTRHCGLVDAWRMPKMAHAWMQAHTARTACVALFVDWSRDGAAERTVHVIGNAPEAVLRCGNHHVTLPLEQHYGTCTIPFADAPLQVELARADGQATAEQAPWGRPHHLALHPVPSPAPAGMRDAMVLRVDVRDSRGTVCRNAEVLLHVGVQGPAAARTYMPTGHAQLTGGTAYIHLMPLPGSGVVRVDVTAPGLAPGLWRSA